ncbi:shikimate dehydrogenase [Bradyrhizobium lablabi]|uniref:shikimate dehydrogenase n=1 Tax=Bradyrhizobium lablabi TaxID=722472 RepID=UPI001BAB2767|nr:shikimate dehydrogenase [Bradyrhizobium lablabi]MBR1121813.1 shikimate dehydrogenase [Bradyrhizobium lablabi]
MPPDANDICASEGHAPSDSVLVGLVGAGIGASLTPRMHMEEGAAQGLRYEYRLIDLDVLGLAAADLPKILTDAERSGFAGLNVTFPCKQAVIAHLDALSPDARAIGAVNTVVLRDGRRVGHNTDWTGFAEGFRRGLGDARRKLVVQFGAGGAGAAVAHALLTLDADRIAIVDTDGARARDLAGALCARFGAGRAVVAEDPARAVAVADGIVNTTPVGMAKFPGMVVAEDWLHPDLWVADIVYFPLETALLRTARNLGCRTMSGAGMAVFQAVKAFELFCGVAPDAERMQRHFERMATGL